MNPRSAALRRRRWSAPTTRRTTPAPENAQRWPRALPLRLRRLANLAPTLLLRSPLYWLMSGRFRLLTYRGRRTGRSYTRWEPKRLRLRLLSIAGRLAATGRRRWLHLAATAPFTDLALQALHRLDALAAPG